MRVCERSGTEIGLQLSNVGRTIKRLLDIEPITHHTLERITAQVHLSVLAYLLTQLATNRTQTGWPLIREKIERISLSEVHWGELQLRRTRQLSAEDWELVNRCWVGAAP